MNKSFLGIQSKTGEITNEQNTELLQDFLDSWLDANDKRLQAKLIPREKFQEKVNKGENLVKQVSDNNITIYFPETNIHKIYPLLDEVRNLTVWKEKTITRHKNQVDDKYRFMGKVAYYLRDLDGLREEIDLTEEESGNLDILVRFFENIAKQLGDVEITKLSDEDKKEVEKYLVGESIAEKVYSKSGEDTEESKKELNLENLKKRKIKQYLKILTYGNKKLNQENTQNSLLKTFTEKHQEALAEAQNMSFFDFNKIVHDEGIIYTADNLTLGKIKEGLESDKNEDDPRNLSIRKIFNNNFIKEYGVETTVKEVINQIMEGYTDEIPENKLERLKKVIQLIMSIGGNISESRGRPSYTLDTGLQQCIMATSFLKVLEDYNINYLPINPIGHVCALVEIDDTVYWCDPIGNKLKQLTDEDFEQSDKGEMMTIELLKKYLHGKHTKRTSFSVKKEFDTMYSNQPIFVGDKHKLLSGSLQNHLGILYFNKYEKTGDEKMFKLAEKYYSLAIENKHTGAYNNLGNLYADKYEKTGDEKMFKLAEKYYSLATENKHTGAYNNLGNLYADKYEKTGDEKMFKLAEKYYTLATENKHTGAYNNLGNLYADKYEKTGDEEMFKLAEKYYTLAIENNDIIIYFSLGDLYSKKGKKVKNKDGQRKYFTLAEEKYQKFIDEGKDKYDEKYLKYAMSKRSEISSFMAFSL